MFCIGAEELAVAALGSWQHLGRAQELLSACMGHRWTGSTLLSRLHQAATCATAQAERGMVVRLELAEQVPPC